MARLLRMRILLKIDIRAAKYTGIFREYRIFGDIV
jgi:hypothetical protein